MRRESDVRGGPAIWKGSYAQLDDLPEAGEAVVYQPRFGPSESTAPEVCQGPRRMEPGEPLVDNLNDARR
jgi:hypothetical protein